MHLFANADPVPFFPPEFLPSIVMSVIYMALAMVFFAGLWKFIDWVTPGKLDEELIGSPETTDENGKVTAHKAPNMALAVVVAALVIGFCLIITAAIK